MGITGNCVLKAQGIVMVDINMVKQAYLALYKKMYITHKTGNQIRTQTDRTRSISSESRTEN